MNFSNIKKLFENHRLVATVLAAILVVIASLSVYFFVYRSHDFLLTRYDEVVIARNWAQTGIAGYEDKNNVVISSSLMPTRGVASTLGNKLTYYIYGIIFRLVGFHPSLPMYISFFLYAVSASLLFLIIKKLFGWSVGLISAGINLVAPFFLPYILSVGKSEWAYFFFIIGTVIYFWPTNYKKISRLAFVGIFLSLSVASRNSYFVTILPVVIMELWFYREALKRRFINVAVLFATFLIIAVPFAFIGSNSYIGLTFGGHKFESFHILGHLFPDPYTFKNERDHYINDLIVKNQNASIKQKFSFWGDSGMFLDTFGATKVGILRSQIIPIIFSLDFYLEAFLSLIVFGGGLMWVLILFGAKILAKEGESNDFIKFSIISFFAWYVALSVTRTTNYPHYLMLIMPLLVFSAVGLLSLARYIISYFEFRQLAKKLVIILVVCMVLLPMFEISWWHLRDYYQNSTSEAMGEQFVRGHKASDFPENGVIAVGYFPKSMVLLNYYFDRNFIYFNPDTIKKIAQEKKIQSVFGEYEIIGVAGYSDKITNLINSETNNKIINY